MKRTFSILVVIATIMIFSASNAMAWLLDLSDSETDPYTLNLSFLLEEGEAIDLVVYQLNVIPTDGYVEATHILPAGMFAMENPTNADDKIGDWSGATFSTLTFDEDLLIGTVSFTYEVTAGVDVFWGYEHQDFGGGINGDDISGLEMYEAGNLSYNGVPVSPVPIPAALWLFGSGLLSFFGLRRRKN